MYPEQRVTSALGYGPAFTPHWTHSVTYPTVIGLPSQPRVVGEWRLSARLKIDFYGIERLIGWVNS